MTARVKALERMRSLYGVLTHVHELALHHASAEIHEAETRIEEQKAMVKKSSEEGLAALGRRDDLGWQMYESQRKFVRRDAMRLLALREEREGLAEKAAELYQAQRTELEQMQSVVDGLRTKMALEHSRREQQESDDRFLTRQRWLEQRDRKRMNPS